MLIYLLYIQCKGNLVEISGQTRLLMENADFSQAHIV